ncbi:PD-(D/E)XK nuclease family protein [Myxococcota bacterium]|nr:PD-(D/E)XK nuclease family protein [Myxococcota bacterium]
MTPEERRFLRDFLALAAEPPSAADDLSPDERAFLTRFLALASDTPNDAGLTPAARTFVEQFCALAATSNAEADAIASFERVIVEPWESIVWRVEGAVSRGFTTLSPDALRQLRVLEDTPSLLAPLRKTRDERSHSELLAWALGLETPLGHDLRRRFLRLLDLDGPVEHWRVEPESVVGPGCRVDVELVGPTGWRCFVEMKVDATERDRQLEDYRKFLGAEGTLVFLTPDGRDGDTTARHSPLSFEDLLTAWLPATTRPEPDARYLAMWLVTIADSVCELTQRGPVFRWDFSRRADVLDLLRSVGEFDA